ncbi:putative reverse transcriptase domain, viral movement protein [Tanacetum coccineum]
MAEPENAESIVQFDAEEYEEHQENPNQETPTEFPKSDIKQYFTFDGVPLLKRRERSIEMLTWCTAELQYYTMDVVIKRFLTRLQGRLRDWYYSLGEYRQLQIQQSISPEAFMSIIYSEFIGSPGHFARNCPDKKRSQALIQALNQVEPVDVSDLESLYSLDDEPSDFVLCTIAYSVFSSDDDFDIDSLPYGCIRQAYFGEGLHYRIFFNSWTAMHRLFVASITLPIFNISSRKQRLIQTCCASSHTEFLTKHPSPLWLNPLFFVSLPFKQNEDVHPTKASHPGMNPDHYQLAKEECEQQVSQGIIEPTTSPWECEAFYVNKRSEQVHGKLRLHLAYAKVLSKFDLKSGFWQLDEQSHADLLSKFYSLVAKYGIMLSEKKIEVGVTTIQFLGMEISDGKYQPQPHVAQELLNESDQVPRRKMPPLKIPASAEKRILQTDASDECWGTVLLVQDNNNKRHVCGYKSGTLKASKQHYHSTFKEILAVKQGIEKFQFRLIGHEFQVEMDMSSYPYMLQFQRKMLPHAQLLRWLTTTGKGTYVLVMFRRPGSFLPPKAVNDDGLVMYHAPYCFIHDWYKVNPSNKRCERKLRTLYADTRSLMARANGVDIDKIPYYVMWNISVWSKDHPDAYKWIEANGQWLYDNFDHCEVETSDDDDDEARSLWSLDDDEHFDPFKDDLTHPDARWSP